VSGIQELVSFKTGFSKEIAYQEAVQYLAHCVMHNLNVCWDDVNPISYFDKRISIDFQAVWVVFLFFYVLK
jgi:hypothetical protein